MRATQRAQYELRRLLDGSRIKDKRSIKDMLGKFKMFSINQTTAQINLMEALKASKEESYPIQMKRKGTSQEEAQSRSFRLATRR